MENIRLDKLKAYCSELQLSPDSEVAVEATAQVLARFEKGRTNLRTLPQQILELDSLKAQANKLIEAIKNTGFQSHYALSCAMRETRFPGDLLTFEKDEKLSQVWNVAISEALKRVIEGVDLAQSSIGNSGKKGGRLLTLNTHAICISNMAFYICARDSIEPGRGGKFEKLCAAVFEAAGVHSKPEGAIKLFMKKHGDEIRSRMILRVNANEHLRN